MSEIKNYRSVLLGHREQQFFSMIADEEMSVYDIFSIMNENKSTKNEVEDDGFEYELVTSHTDELSKGMAYKNVHKRVKRLESLGLIEDTNEKQRKNIIKYRITSRGLFQCLLQSHSSIIYSKYEDSIILKTLLYEFFERETVKKIIEIFGDWFFRSFLEKCCREIQFRVDGIFSELEFDEPFATWKKTAPHFYNEKIERIFHPESPNGEFIEGMIRNEAKNVIHEIVRKSNQIEYKDNFPNPVLVRDERFKEMVQEIKHEFESGCKNLLPVS